MARPAPHAPPPPADDLFDQAIAVLQPRTKRVLTREDAREALYNLNGVFALLAQWKKEQLVREITSTNNRP